MAINKNSNLYIITYTVVMVVIVGALLATLATLLKDKQAANVLNEQKTSIMKAFGEADASFDEVVTMGRIAAGEFVAVEEADVKSVFELLGNRKALSEAQDNLPIFKMEKDGVIKFVLPIVGKISPITSATTSLTTTSAVHRANTTSTYQTTRQTSAYNTARSYPKSAVSPSEQSTHWATTLMP